MSAKLKRGLVVALAMLLAAFATMVSPASPSQATPKPTPDSAIRGGLPPKKLPTAKVPKRSPLATSKTKTTACPTYGSLTVCWDYATRKQTLIDSADGMSIDASVVKPTLYGGDHHSLAQMTLIDGTYGNENVVELGWTVDPGTYGGSSNPHLFVSHWINGIWQCYNCGFVNAPGAPFVPGSNLFSHIGTVKSFKFEYVATGTPRWEASYNGSVMGHFPASIWSGAFTDFDQSQAYGEVATSRNPSETDMGSGVLAGPAQGAQFSNYALTGTTDTVGFNGSNGTQADRWALSNTSTTAFRYGGPGGHSTYTGFNVPADNCSGVGTPATNPGGYGTFCHYQNTSGGAPINKIPSFDKDGTVPRNTCFPNLGKTDGLTTSPIRVVVNTHWVKWAWFRDANCAGAHIDIDHASGVNGARSVLPAGWTNLDHASLMRWSTPASCGTAVPNACE